MNQSYQPKAVRSLGARSLAMGAIIFSVGMCSADTIRYRLASAQTQTDLPRVEVAYNQHGTYVNGERVRSDGLIGAPRCEIDSLPADRQRALAVEIMQKQPRVLGDYATQLGERAWRALLYQTIKSGVEEDSLRGAALTPSYGRQP